MQESASRGGSALGGVCSWGGVCSGGVKMLQWDTMSCSGGGVSAPWGRSALGGVLLPGQVELWGLICSRGVSALGGVSARSMGVNMLQGVWV